MQKNGKTKNTRPKIKHGLTICYIGAGKGKTTAAMGVAVRASGAGMNVHILQFVKATAPKKGQEKQPGEWSLSNEIIFFNNVHADGPVGEIKSEQLGRGFVGILGDQKKRVEHVQSAEKALERAHSLLKSPRVDVLILDELVSAVELKLLKISDVVRLIKAKPSSKHLVMTGHNRFPKIIQNCDLVTEMTMIKHPYYKGILAQKGIDF